ncbi:hypothetical protein EMPS_11216 [Entomortierella parvispora]|uniref:Uncharacterized protein n=1 Tax=Entomortierella parvispora TaxID=205924 RepID=A0A9P3HMK9_9FUNG|nr:hypothetical protein EMPS_11216 [Entomortierella parvispora]
MDSFQSLHLPPTFHPSTSSQPEATAAQRSAASQKTQNPTTTGTSSNAPVGQSAGDGIKTEGERTEKVPAPRKKRGQYKKTILRQQHEAAAAAAVAAGLPPPECPFPLKRRSTPKSKANAEPPLATSSPTTATSASGSTSQAHSSTIESLNVRPPKTGLDRSPTALEMEQELAMLAEEAEEDRKRRDEEAADRILKRAQVVNHLRSLKSKLASAQIQIGQDLHYQSMDLFSDIFDEVLEDIGKDNSEMLELIKNSRLEHKDPADHKIKLEPTAEQLGHMPTRSSDRPRKRDLVSSVPRHHHQARTLDIDQDSDREETTVKRYKRGKGSDRFIGQTWDVADGDTRGRNKENREKAGHLEVDDPLVDDEVIKIDRTVGINGSSEAKTAFRTREDLQTRHRLELEQLQLQQRKDQEEFQRKQLEQLRDLQMRQNEEFRVFEADKARRYRERMEGLVDKRATFTQSSLHHNSSRSEKSRRSSYSLSRSLRYEFDNGFEHDLTQELDDSPSSRSPSRSPSPQPVNRSRGTTLLQRGTPAPKPRHNNGHGHGHGHGGVHSFPMSTMTMALTAMNEKKRQMKRTQKKHHGQEDFDEHDLSDESLDNSDYERHLDAKSSKLLRSPSWGQKRSALDDSSDIKRRSTSVTPSVRSSSSSHSRTLHYQSQHTSHSTDSQLKHPSGESSQSAHYEHSTHRSTTDSLSSSSKQRTKKQKQEAPHLSSTPTSGKGLSEQDQEPKPAIGFNKTLLSHFERWNPDTKTENFFDFVLSDPPDVDVDDSEVEGLLNRTKQPAERPQSKDMNVTPTSNAFRWYQEQQKLAQEISRQPKMKPLNFESLVEDDQSHASLNSADAPNPFGATTGDNLTLGVDPLAAFIPKNRGVAGSPAVGFSMNVSSDHDNGAESNLAPDSSPMISSSPAMNLLYSDDGEHDWGFNPFMVDSSDQYLHQESPLNSNHDDFELQF